MVEWYACDRVVKQNIEEVENRSPAGTRQSDNFVHVARDVDTVDNSRKLGAGKNVVDSPRSDLVTAWAIDAEDA